MEPRPAGRFLPLSARTEASLRALCERYAARLAAADDDELEQVCRAAAHRRDALLEYRVAVPAASVGDAAAQLRRVVQGGALRPVAAKGQRVAFLFAGDGSGYAGMARELAAREPGFARVLARCGDGEDVALYAVQCGLVELWRAWGVEPDVVLGHAVGEYAAAYCAGVFTLGGRAEARAGAGAASWRRSRPPGRCCDCR